ncbi:MAG: membrane protein insertase YidC [Elusimicrobia bacterium]|nr:membrane protein insertase YidC [Candidatus Liberimonas magnetica]
MEKNTFLAIVLSTLFLILWWTFYPQQHAVAPQPLSKTEQAKETQGQQNIKPELLSQQPKTPVKEIAEKEITIDTNKYHAVFTTRGAAIKHWVLKENMSRRIDLSLSEDLLMFSTFNDINFEIVEQTPKKIIFAAQLPQNKKITKTYTLSDTYIQNLKIDTNTPFKILIGQGLGTDETDKDENIKLTRALAYPVDALKKMENLKIGEYDFPGYKWAALDNRYFLSAIIPENDKGFDKIIVSKSGKKEPPSLILSKEKFSGDGTVSISVDFYLGPKLLSSLKALNIGFENTIDFGMFGFLSKIALEVLNFFYRLTVNFGWSIILLTVVIQIIVFPLTIKSFKAQAAMKKLNPMIKEIQTKFKSDPKRLNIEMLNVYKTQKVNPLGGCLPMLLQIPIFWALFNALRTTYELRGAPWIFWIKDLSVHDPYYILPVVMGIGMLFQQKMVSVSADPTQAKMMYLMPVVFTFMFLKFPSGLVLYWLTNSMISMIEQYFIMLRQEEVGNV